MATDLELLRRHEPIVRFNEGEYFFPASVEAFVARAELWERTGPADRTLVAGAGTLDLDGLVAHTARRGPDHYLRLVTKPMTGPERLAWRHRRERPRFRAETRLGQVGVLPRFIDAAARFSLLLRGTVPAGHEAAAEVLHRDRPDADDHPYYGRVVRDGGYVVLQYWFFYFFNDWRSRAHGVNDHEGDWEQVTIFLAPTADGDPEPRWVVYSSHDTAGADLRRRWDDPDLTVVDGHPVVHAGLGSHAGAFLAGEYLTWVRGTRLAGVRAVTGRVRRLLLPWERGRRDEGLRIPYVDYKRGDGLAIGPGAPRPWRPVVVDDETPWVREYRGLWGNDTDDRFGGERGPAGPRYERSGSVRRSWGDPVGWAALDAVSPSSDDSRAVVATRVEELDAELAQLAAGRDVLRGRVRAAVAGGATDTAAEEDELARLAERATVRADELRRLRAATGEEPADPGPHAHLRVRPLPLPTEAASRRRFLRVWATVSTPLLIALVGFMVISRGWALLTLGGFGLLAVFALEAIARRRLVAFVLTVAALFAATSIALAVVTGLFASWRITVGIVVFAAAAGVLVANVRELIRT